MDKAFVKSRIWPQNNSPLCQHQKTSYCECCYNIKWLHHKRKEECGKSKMNQQNGHLFPQSNTLSHPLYICGGRSKENSPKSEQKCTCKSYCMINELVNVFFVVYNLSIGMTVYMQCEFKCVVLYFWLLEYYFSYW